MVSKALNSDTGSLAVHVAIATSQLESGRWKDQYTVHPVALQGNNLERGREVMV